MLIHVVTELPRPAGREHKDAALRRELVHRLGHQECSHSEVRGRGVGACRVVV